MSKYIKIPVDKEAFDANVRIFHKALQIIGDGSEGTGKRVIKERVNCSGAEIKKIIKDINNFTLVNNATISNTLFHINYQNTNGLENYCNYIRISHQNAYKILSEMISLLIEKNACAKSDCFKHFFDCSEYDFIVSYLNALLGHALRSWEEQLPNDLFYEFNRHLRNPRAIILNTYKSVITLHERRL